MDEPLGALDAEFRALMCGELRELHDRISATTVYVTHDQHEAMSMADRIAVMNAGRIEQIGVPQEIYDRPASMFVADFIGSPPMNFLHFEAGLAAGDRVIKFPNASVAIPEIGEARAPGPLVLGVRPEHIRFADAAPVRGRVFGAEYLGTTQIVTVDTEQGQVKARLPSSLSVQVGEMVGLTFRSDALSLFDAQTGAAIRTASHWSVGHG
jgi:multiple sugar transport system ATP-binding protein